MSKTAMALVVGMALAFTSLAGSSAHADEPAARVAPSPEATTPETALRRLREGNERFAAGLTLRRDLVAQVSATKKSQHPYAAILGCIDSRVPPELVFDTGIGDVFSARIAGNVLTDELLGSLEFAAQVVGAKLIVVLGHTECGAVKGACDGVKLGHLTGTLALIAPALAAASGVSGPHDASNAEYVRHVTEANVRLSARALLERSAILRELEKSGDLRVAPALYDVATGRVTFLE